MKHVLSQIDEKKQVANCSVCGVNTRVIYSIKPIKKDPERKVYRCATSSLNWKGSKYRNKPMVSRDGKSFQSTKEGRRYETLLLLQKAGEIRDLQTQVSYQLHGVKGSKVCRYVADFVYQERGKDGKFYEVVEDVKGRPTDVFKLKKKLFEDEYKELRIT